jgi:RNA polymerase sigma factor (sigma-70 family)
MLAEDMRSPEADERFTLLFERHYPEGHAYCTRRIGYGEADDVAAEVFATAWRRWDNIDWETVAPWLYGIARRVLANRWRSLRRRTQLARRIAGMAPTLPDTPELYVVRLEVDGDVFEALQSLRPPDREILMLAAWEELNGPQIAEVLGITTAAAEQRLHRAKVRFSMVLEPGPQDPEACREGGDR